MRIVVTAVALAMASLLLAAALEKARHLAAFAATLRELGVPRGASIVVVLEGLVGLAILFRPDIAAGGVLILAMGFLTAGIAALQRPRAIRCHCFGGDGTLGHSQIVAFPFWLAGAALLWLQQPPEAWRPAMFAAAGLMLATLRGASALREALRARADRRSAKEMYVWLR